MAGKTECGEGVPRNAGKCKEQQGKHSPDHSVRVLVWMITRPVVTPIESVRTASEFNAKKCLLVAWDASGVRPGKRRRE